MNFKGLVRTDGKSISILLDDRAAVQRQKIKRRRVEPSLYFEDNIDEIRRNRVYIDPNRRDLLYCLGEDENGEDSKLRYPSMQRRKEGTIMSAVTSQVNFGHGRI